MPRVLLTFLLCCSLLLNAQQQFTKPAATEMAGFSGERLKKLDGWLLQLVKDDIVPNAVTFIAREGKVVHNKAYGYSDMARKKPAAITDIFRIASQSKAITTVALLTLYEEGKFLLDDPVGKYLPEFSLMQVLDSYDATTGVAKTHPAQSPVTIRQLLSHTAGIPYEHPMEKIDSLTLPYFNSLENESLEQVCKRIAKRPLLHEPGQQFTYGLGIDVAGRLAEVLSGKSLDKFLQETVLAPLGMNDTYFYLPAAKKQRLVKLYTKTSANEPLAEHSNNAYKNFATQGAQTYFSGGAGLVGTIEDYAKFCQMIVNGGEFNGKRILSRKTTDMMAMNMIGNSKIWTRNDQFGLGFEVVVAGSNYGDPATPGSLIWGGMYCSEFTIDPKEKLIALIFTNVHPYYYYNDFVKKFRILTYQALK
jgi:CubicO group peptidase (beta-lactamase class C family)